MCAALVHRGVLPPRARSPWFLSHQEGTPPSPFPHPSRVPPGAACAEVRRVPVLEAPGPGAGAGVDVRAPEAERTGCGLRPGLHWSPLALIIRGLDRGLQPRGQAGGEGRRHGLTDSEAPFHLRVRDRVSAVAGAAFHQRLPRSVRQGIIRKDFPRASL
jgi:hypothetical protein